MFKWYGAVFIQGHVSLMVMDECSDRQDDEDGISELSPNSLCFYGTRWNLLIDMKALTCITLRINVSIVFSFIQKYFFTFHPTKMPIDWTSERHGDITLNRWRGCKNRLCNLEQRGVFKYDTELNFFVTSQGVKSVLA